MRLARCGLLALVGLLATGAVACGGGRDFQAPKTLAEYRPVRRTTAPAATDDAAEAFRASPPAPARAAEERRARRPSRARCDCRTGSAS